LAHELGHRILHTSDELLADAFALGLTAGRQRGSLKSALRAIGGLDAVPYPRLLALYSQCRKIDNQNKSKQ